MSAKSRGVIERSLSSFVDALQHTFDAEELAKNQEVSGQLHHLVEAPRAQPGP